MAEASVQPVPWLCCVSMRSEVKRIAWPASIRISVSVVPARWPPLASTAAPVRAESAAAASSSCSGRLDHPSGQRRELRPIGSNERGAPRQPLEGGDGRFVGQPVTTGCDHDRVEDDGDITDAFEPRRQRRRRFRAADHADLDHVRAEIAQHRVDLPQHHLERHGHYRLHAQRVLRGDGGDRGGGEAAEHGDGLDIRLDARAPAAVRAGNDEDSGRGHFSSTPPARPERSRGALEQSPSCAPRRRSGRTRREYGATPLITSSSRSFSDRRGRIFLQPFRLARGPALQPAAAIRADEIEAPIRALSAEGAFERADPGFVRVGRQVAAAQFAIGAHVEAHAACTASQIESTTSSTRALSSPSAITRISGSVPDLRMTRRPVPSSLFSRPRRLPT